MEEPYKYSYHWISHNWLVWMYPKEFARPVKQKVLAQAKGYACVCKQLLLLGICNAFLWRSFCLEAFASFYAVILTLPTLFLILLQTLRAFLPAMLEANSGHIVTTCSTGGQTAMHRLTDYCASKFGILGLDEALESELRDVYQKNGIRQTLVCPHFLNTGLIHSIQQR